MRRRTAPNANARAYACLMPAVAICICGLVTGCNRSPYDLAPVDGTVTIDGKPLSGARVMFAPIARAGSLEAGKPAVGRLATDGTFHLTTYSDGDGAVIGEHWVTIIKQAADPDDPNAAAAKGNFVTPTFDRLAVPKKVSVTSDQPNHIDIKLTAAEVSRFGRLFD
jgi:hypothetical protein